MSDPQKYRTKDEVDQFKTKDSIAALLNHLMNDRGAIDEDAWKAMRSEIRDEVKDSVEFAESAEAPDVDQELYSDVFVFPQPNLSPTRDYIHGSKNPLL